MMVLFQLRQICQIHLWSAGLSSDLSLQVRSGDATTLTLQYYTCQSLELSHSQPHAQRGS